MKKIGIAALAIASLVGCSALLVRQSDLDSWTGMPVEALDTHSLFLTVPMFRTLTESGIEIRNYANTKSHSSCSGGGGAKVSSSGKYMNANTYSNCTSETVGCNNIFYIKDGKVLEYAPTGQCYTNETVRPQRRYLDLVKRAG